MDSQRIMWLTRLPDLNPKQNLSCVSGRCLDARPNPPTHKPPLIGAVTEEWKTLTQSLINQVTQSMPLCVKSFIELRGERIPY